MPRPRGRGQHRSVFQARRVALPWVPAGGAAAARLLPPPKVCARRAARATAGLWRLAVGARLWCAPKMRCATTVDLPYHSSHLAGRTSVSGRRCLVAPSAPGRKGQDASAHLHMAAGLRPRGSRPWRPHASHAGAAAPAPAYGAAAGRRHAAARARKIKRGLRKIQSDLRDLSLNENLTHVARLLPLQLQQTEQHRRGHDEQQSARAASSCRLPPAPVQAPPLVGRVRMRWRRKACELASRRA
jgi:hypothetical protein